MGSRWGVVLLGTWLATGGVAVAQAPTVRVVSPIDGAILPLDAVFDLSGWAVDANGQRVADLTWSSTLSGQLGRGERLRVGPLVPGVHRVRLDARDSQGRAGSAFVTIALAGAGDRQGEDLIGLAGSLATRILGDPPRWPPDFRAMIRANPARENAAVGNGGLTAAFAADGTMTVLRWPTPSYDDQMDHLVTDRSLPRMGAFEDMGAFGGLVLALPGGRVTTWFRDPEWRTAQRYFSTEDNVLVTTHRHEGLDLWVIETAFVHPERDVLAIRFTVRAGSTAPVRQGELLFFENLAPCTDRIPSMPVRDWLLDVLNDYAAVYHQGEDAIVHFRPARADYAELVRFEGRARRDPLRESAAFVDAAPRQLGRGAAFAIGGDERSDGWSVGPDSTGVAPGAARREETAYEDARDGVLSGRPFAVVRASAVLAKRIDFLQQPASWTVYVAAGADADEARAALRWARSRPFGTHATDTLRAWRAWIRRARMPRTADARILAVCRRSLIAARTACDRRTGAIVASVSSQLPYALDWPRDGAFINRALDIAGYAEMVEAHNRFYARVQRAGWFLPGSTEMNYWSDGLSSGFIPFEIDEAALLVWTLWDHALFLADPAARQRYLAEVYPAIRRGADLMVSWRDAATGLPLPANEDDNLSLTQGLQGSITAHLALGSAVAAGRAVGEDPARIARWMNRRAELRRAIDARFWDRSRGTFVDTSLNAPGAVAWVLWPAGFLPRTDARARATGSWLHSVVVPTLERRTAGGGYDAKTVMSLAWLWRDDPARMDEVRRLVRLLAYDVASPDTGHFGEFYDVVERNGRRVFVNANNVPHVWEHALFYLCAMAAYR